MIVLGIETSCDDTSAALFSPERGVIAEYTAGQLIHGKYGGVVPEIASRAHLKTLLPVFRQLILHSGVDKRAIDAIGVSNGPGLLGSLLVGVGFAKALSYSLRIPITGVHHIEAHILANEIELEELQYPCVVLVVSGGHTCLYHIKLPGSYDLIGATRDDAAGEAFDKIAKLLGLGFPGGPAVERAAGTGNPASIHFPRAMPGRDNFDFSFSGLKTAVRLHVEGLGTLDERSVADVAAAAQAAIVDVLVKKTVACAKQLRVAHAYLAGGVAANGPLRGRLHARCTEEGITYHAPVIRYCTDNGAMVACCAAKQIARGRNDGLALDVFARGALPSWA
ncbi:MAG: tRNA (adenosine(37)-N6)-threonylcarbamoyltransferase complex transferase subunit TsaD [Candidatus Latescibacterota bacterium]